MKLGTIVTTSFIISFILTLVGAYLKIIHSEGADTWLTIGIIASIVFIVSSSQVQSDKKHNFEINNADA